MEDYCGLAGVWLVLVHTGITSCPKSPTSAITRAAWPSCAVAAAKAGQA